MKRLIFSVLVSVLSLAGLEGFAQKSGSSETSDGKLDVFIPNAFTPNGDKYNDLFIPVISGPEIEFYDFIIIDRSGKEVFRSSDPNEPWNGSVKGGEYVSTPSIFIYYLKVKSVSSLENQVFQGHITMIR